MIQPGHGTVLYNKGQLHLACVARTERVSFKICTQDGSAIFQDRMDMGANINGWAYYIFYKEIDVSILVQDTDYYVTYWYEDSDTREQTVIFDAFIYKPGLATQYQDYPYIGNWVTKTELDKAESTVNSNTDSKINEIKADIKTSYLGNKKVEMTYCTEIPDPNPRNLFIGCADYIKETIRLPGAKSWTSPISEIIMYYYYDEDGKQIQVNGD